jgi:hypothetical protein
MSSIENVPIEGSPIIGAPVEAAPIKEPANDSAHIEDVLVENSDNKSESGPDSECDEDDSNPNEWTEEDDTYPDDCDEPQINIVGCSMDAGFTPGVLECHVFLKEDDVNNGYHDPDEKFYAYDRAYARAYATGDSKAYAADCATIDAGFYPDADKNFTLIVLRFEITPDYSDTYIPKYLGRIVDEVIIDDSAEGNDMSAFYEPVRKMYEESIASMMAER